MTGTEPVLPIYFYIQLKKSNMKNYNAVNDKLHALVPLGIVPADRKLNVPQNRSEYSG